MLGLLTNADKLILLKTSLKIKSAVICLPVCPLVCPSICLFVCLPVRLSVCHSICLSNLFSFATSYKLTVCNYPRPVLLWPCNSVGRTLEVIASNSTLFSFSVLAHFLSIIQNPNQFSSGLVTQLVEHWRS